MQAVVSVHTYTKTKPCRINSKAFILDLKLA
jgi:hypothetical protein